jgi:UDP-N-acetyl-D-galactosamine dehydrogenase
VVLAVAHREFKALGAGVREYAKPGGVVYDVKSALPRDAVDGRL